MNDFAVLPAVSVSVNAIEEAVECGLASRAVEPDALLSETMELARRIAKMPVASSAKHFSTNHSERTIDEEPNILGIDWSIK